MSLTWMVVAIAVEVVILHLVKDVHTTFVTTTQTDGKAKFVLGNDYGVPVSGHSSLTFEVKACGNVYLLLAEKMKVSSRRGNYYFISIGVTKSHRISGVIEGCYACNTFHNYKLKTVVNCTEFRKFRVSWDGQGSVNIYQSPELTDRPLLHYKGKRKYPINFFHVTSYNLTAEFRFHLPCPEGSYGDNCTSVCGHCKCGNHCDPERGSCRHGCDPGWTGPLCVEECSNNTYGPNCSKCGKCRHGMECDAVTGRCPGASCLPGWVGDKCDRECHLGTYGPYCRPCGYCRDGSVCDRQTGHCPEDCQPGWTAEKCDIKCPQMTHGQNCTSCGHCLGEDSCHIETGHCPQGCDPGWFGPLCKDRCKPYTFGINCVVKCGRCKNSALCSHVTGFCPYGCQPGWYGSRCDRECPQVTYGTDCMYTCGHCFNGSQCDQVTGACADGCENGWKGANCDKIDVPNEIRMTTEPPPRDRKKGRFSPVPLRADTIISIVLGIFIALLMGILIMLLWRRAVNRHESKYRANYNGRCDTKEVQLDYPSTHDGNASYDNPGYINLNGNQSQL